MDNKIATQIAALEWKKNRKGPGDQEKPFVYEAWLVNKKGLQQVV